MVDANHNTAGLEALRRLLGNAAGSPEAKVDALLALAQREVFAVMLTTAEGGYRVVVSSAGMAALPVFTGQDELSEAARRYGWLNPNGTISQRQMGFVEALQYARSRDISYVVVDVTAPHALEVTSTEMDALIKSQPTRQNAPLIGERLSSSLRDSVRPAPFPIAIGSIPRIPLPDSQPSVHTLPLAGADNDPFGIDPPTLPHIPSARDDAQSGARRSVRPLAPPATTTWDEEYGAQPERSDVVSATQATVLPLEAVPSRLLLDELFGVLRDYPEVRWAVLMRMARSANAARLTLGVHLAPGQEGRLDEISEAAQTVGRRLGTAFAVVAIAGDEMIRNARSRGLVFYPWRTPSSP